MSNSPSQQAAPVGVLKQEIDYTKFLRIIFSRWYWILGTLIISLCVGYFYLWNSDRVYTSSAYVKFEDKKSDLDNLVNLTTINQNTTNKIISESWVFKSREVTEKAVDHLDWEVSYFVEGRVKTSDLYPNKPFTLHILKKSDHYYTNLVQFKRVKEGYQLDYVLNGKDISQKYKFGTEAHLPGITFYIDDPGEVLGDDLFAFKFNYKSDFYQRIVEGLNIVEAARYSSVAVLSKTDSNPYFAADAINAIVQEYLKQDLDKKTKSATQIIKFIDQQLSYLSENVQTSGNKLKNFKEKNKFLDLTATSKEVMGKISEAETESRTLDLQILLIDQLTEKMKKGENNINLNFNLEGKIDGLLGQLIVEWNEEIAKREDLLVTYKLDSKPVKEVDKILSSIRSSAIDNINSTKKNLLKQKNLLKRQLDEEYSKLKDLPQQEKELFGLQRDYEINDKIYTYLSEKKLEAQIQKASVLSEASLIDVATPNTNPISPNKATVWRFTWIFGLGIGIGLIFMVRSLNPYIYDKEMIESLTKTPIVGIIRHYPEKIDSESGQMLSITKPKSLFAESVRSVRTNLSFIASEKKSKVICITSEISGEGKSFVSINLAASLALIDKKVILIAADMRKSKIHKAFKIDNSKGLSSLLAQKNTLDEIIYPSGHDYMDVISSGPVPPNPAELMYKAPLKLMIEELRKIYDFIIFDTAPIGLVSDALPLIRVSDINLFVIRTGKSKFTAASIPDRVASEYHLNNTFIILNDFVQESFYSHYYTTKYTDGYYGYYYADTTYNGDGYYDDNKKKGWWKVFTKNIKNRFSI